MSKKIIITKPKNTRIKKIAKPYKIESTINSTAKDLFLEYKEQRRIVYE